MPTDYNNRIKIPITGTNIKFYTKCDVHIAHKYERIVIGGRGPYIEFIDNQLIWSNITMPEYAKYRLKSDCYYLEYRTTDYCKVKIYFQKKTVDYADYRIGHFYISPFDLKTDEIFDLVEPENLNKNAKKFFE